jgi:hypothetical protein
VIGPLLTVDAVNAEVTACCTSRLFVIALGLLPTAYLAGY